MAEQTLASGLTATQRFSGLGCIPTYAPAPLASAFGMILGFKGHGKSYLQMSNPEAFIINVDVLPVSHPQMKAAIWPIRDPNANVLLDVDGKPMRLTAEAIETKVTKLEQLAASNSPRPKTVVIDTLGSLVEIYKVKALKRYERDSWDKVDGRYAWPFVYDQCVELFNRIRNAGYGLWLIGHLTESIDEIKSGDIVRKERRIEPTFSDAFYNRFSQAVEVIVVVERAISDGTVEEDVTIGGRTVKRPRDCKIVKHICVVHRDDSLNRYLRGPSTMTPSFEIPKETAWETFERVYREALIKAAEAQTKG